MKFKELFRRLKYLINRAEIDINYTKTTLRERTESFIDLRYNSCRVIVAGKNKNQDYVEIFEVKIDDFQEVIRILQEMNRRSGLRRIDAPIGYHDIKRYFV